MKDIKELREKINQIDKEMAALYENRMNTVNDIAEYKIANNMAILDKNREKEVLERNLSYISNDNLLPLYSKFINELMGESKAYQRYVINSIYDDVVIGKGVIKELDKYINLNRKVLIISDTGIPKKYINVVSKQCKECYVRYFPKGEANKNIDTYELLLFALTDKQFTRNDLIIALGGGVTTDLAGFVASSYMRGIEFVNIPTTLLAQVDASIGGKVAIDFNGYKNLVGQFYKPSKVLIDVDTLKTLDDRLFLEGISEVIKIAITLDKDFYLYLESLDLDGFKKNIEYIVSKSVKLKSAVISIDEHETGIRKVLNFGHTIGHAAECLSKGKLLHGEAVSIGMTYMVEEPLRSRLVKCLKKYGLPTECKYTADELIGYIEMDKKKIDADKIVIVTCPDIGKYEFKETTLLELKEKIKRK